MQAQWALRRKQTRRWITLVNTPRRFARQFRRDPLAVERVANAYRTALKGASRLGKLGRGRFNRERVLEVLREKAGKYQGPVMLLEDGKRRRVNAEEGAIYRGAVLSARRRARGADFKDAMRFAHKSGISSLVPNPLEILRARPVVCRRCEKVFVRPLAATAQKYCPTCQRRYTRQQRWWLAHKKRQPQKGWPPQ